MGTSTMPTDLYVSMSGSDSNPGTQAAPFRTISAASQAATPGTTVHVAPGTYAGGFTTTASGTASDHIEYISDQRWGATILGGWTSKGAYTDIIGFDVNGSGTSATVGLYLCGSYSSAQYNNVHDIHVGQTSSTQGAAGIEAESYYGGTNILISNNVVHNIGSGGYDHGVYVIAPYSTIANNLIYDVTGFGVHGWHDDRNETIVNNTIFHNGGGIVFGGGGYYNYSG